MSAYPAAGRRRDGEGWLEAGGARLEYRRLPACDADAGAPLVLLHEGLGCCALWKDFPDRLAAATGREVFLWSRAGFGRSDPVPLPRPLDYLDREADLVPHVLAAAGLERVILVGHSDGGTIALLTAAAGGSERAPVVEGVVTMAAHVFVEDVTIAGILRTRRAWREGDLRPRLARWHGANVDVAFSGWCDTWLDPRFRTWNVEDRLPRVRAPVLALQGEGDEYGTAAQVQAIVDGVSGPARPLMLPEAGHSPHLDRPDAVVDAITRFLATLPPALAA